MHSCVQIHERSSRPSPVNQPFEISLSLSLRLGGQIRVSQVLAVLSTILLCFPDLFELIEVEVFSRDDRQEKACVAFKQVRKASPPETSPVGGRACELWYVIIGSTPPGILEQAIGSMFSIGRPRGPGKRCPRPVDEVMYEI